MNNVILDVSDKLRVYNYNDELSEYINGLCTYENPDWTKAVTQGFATFGLKQLIKTCAFNCVDNQYFIECPRGTLRNIYEFIVKKGFTPTVKQNRLKLPEHEVEFKRELWSHQTEAVQSAIKRSQGVIVSPAGSGKTTIGCAIIAKTKQPTLWVTHKIELVDQTKAEIIACTDIKEEEIGVLGNCQKQEGSKVTICTIQTISLMDLDEIKNNYGCVIVDEVHHCPAKTWFDTINCLPAFYRFGLTATINREDGLTDLIHMVVGKTIYEVSREDLIHAKKILPAQVFTIDNYTE